jgi:hypothetical protein
VSAIRPVLDQEEGSCLPWLLERQLLKEEPMGKPVGSPYSWQAMHSGKVLDVAYASPDNGALIIQWDRIIDGRRNQQFHLDPLGGDQFALRAAHSGKVLDVANASSDNGVQIIQWDWHGGSNQRWRRLPYAVRIDDSQ